MAAAVTCRVTMQVFSIANLDGCCGRHGRGRGGVLVLGNVDDVLLPDDLGDHVTVGNVLGADDG